MKRQLKATIRSLPYNLLLDRMGRPPKAVTRYEDPLQAIFSQSDTVFSVPADRCKYTYQFSYGLTGWHPFVQTLRQYLKKPALAYESSILREYYQRFQPKVILDLYFEGSEREELSETRLGQWPIGTHFPCLPWDPKLVAMRAEGGLSVADGLQGFGPVTEVKGAWEFSRLVTTCNSIRKKGYRPTRDSDGEIRGYFLKWGNDYRFLIRAGFHRAAVLSALGEEELRVKFKANFPRVIDLSDLEHWPLVRQGLVEEEVAERIFQRFFSENGSGKARNLGLL